MVVQLAPNYARLRGISGGVFVPHVSETAVQASVLGNTGDRLNEREREDSCVCSLCVSRRTPNQS